MCIQICWYIPRADRVVRPYRGACVFASVHTNL